MANDDTVEGRYCFARTVGNRDRNCVIVGDGLQEWS